ncbi:hypothetical protein AALA54_13415 [Oscillospiraceae bacterium 44-34]
MLSLPFSHRIEKKEIQTGDFEKIVGISTCDGLEIPGKGKKFYVCDKCGFIGEIGRKTG